MIQAKFFKENTKPITTALSKQFEQDAKTLAAMLDPDNPPHVGDLPKTVKTLKSYIAISRAKTFESRLSLAQETSKMHGVYRQIIKTSIRVLEQTIHGSVARGTKAKADYLAVVAESMSKKLQLQDAQLMTQLYSSDIREALQTKQQELESESRITKRKVREAEEKLEEYEKAGGMQGMAQEYAEVLKETERVKAEIERLEGEHK